MVGMSRPPTGSTPSILTAPSELQRKFRVRVFLMACATVAMVGAARGNDTRDALAQFVKCAEIADPAKRLECFDAATARGKAALAAPPPQVAQPPKEKSLLEWFGFSRPAPVTKPEEFGKPAPEPEVTQISDNVLEFAKTPRGKAVFILENGQVWRQIDGDSTDVYAAPPGAKMRVTIEVGVLGSYNLTIDGRKGLIKVNRLK
jgi:hypothetical protein